MSKRNYIHVQALLLEEKTQREVAKYYGFRDKYAVKQLLTRERRKERKLEVGILPRPKGRPRKIQQRKILWPSRLMRFSGLVWKMNCCGILCNPKITLRVMKKYDLLSEIRMTTHWQKISSPSSK